MICKVCKEEIDDRLTKCPFCGTTTGAGMQNNAEESRGYQGGFSEVQSGGMSIFDSEDFEEEVVTEVYEDDDSDIPEKNNRYKYIVAGLTVAIVAFVIVLLCILYFSGVIGGKPEVTTTTETTTEAPTVITTEEITTQKPVTTAAPTTEATTIDYGEGVRRPDYVTLELVEGKATVDSLNVRKSPTTDEDNRITAVAKDSKLTIYGADSKEDAEWYFVYFEAEKIYGWVSADYVDVDGDVTFKTSGSSTPTITEEATEATSLQDNTSEPVVSDETQADVENTTDTTDTTAATTDEEKTEEAAGDEDKYYEVTANGGLNFRSSPDSDSDNYITTLETGTKVKLVKMDGDWAQVYFEEKDLTGWVSAKYIKEIQ